jgi:mannose-6-phosphate isomerase-like protein (cupin superfamily)
MNETSTKIAGTPVVHHELSRSFVFQGFELRILMTSEQTAGQFSMIEGLVPPGGDSGFHVQHHEDERLVVLEGSFEVTLGAETYIIAQGESYFAPRGTPHRLRNTGSEPSRAMVVTTPGGFDEFVSLAGSPIVNGIPPQPSAPTPEDLGRLFELAERYGIEMLPDPSQ